MSIPVNHKFACLSFQWMAAEAQGQPLELSDGCSVHYRPPFDLDDTWKDWLGTIDVRKLSESTFILLATAPSANPGVVDDEHRALDKMVHSLWYALLLHGVPDYQGVLSFQGSNVNGEIQVRSRLTLPPYYKPRHVRPLSITDGVLRGADTVALGIRTIYGERGSYARLKRGLMGGWLAGMREHYGDARLHQFVRATEALIKPRIGETRRNFAHRGQVFLGASENNREFLGELFDLRSTAEHMNDFWSVLNHIPAEDRERVGWLRAYQAELLAGWLYIRVFSDRALLETFRNDESIDEFWGLAEAQQRARFGSPLDVQRLAAERHTIEPEPGAAPIHI